MSHDTLSRHKMVGELIQVDLGDASSPVLVVAAVRADDLGLATDYLTSAGWVSASITKRIPLTRCPFCQQPHYTHIASDCSLCTPSLEP